ncbi:proline--tRNA ligase [Alkalicoccus urumqiensis]|uniref:Proline--tRNA ligase n=1 Tax=Alkalicoccus urumqiensis TaxID=1548213 RepID=A0A2P6MFX5_ALKUR|nr:proline--tRNA ligase [Alkalicoccus urumqiensis]PRO65195.1 proline--tRNA ligase [Alkalicoccus urumqiensis]
MRQSSLFLPTLRDVPGGADVISHQLMLRAGMIRQSTAGVYSFLPFGWKALQKVERIVREEMDLAGAQEMLMPSIQPAELWQKSGRWEAYGPELMRLKDRHQRDFALGPTHEEVVASLVSDDIRSYKELPKTVYQIQTKFRDERRPRFGILRGREFLMKDAYSLDKDEAGLDESYQQMYDAYHRIFSRLNLNFRAVTADSGAMGGKDTHEFMVLSDIGEDTIAYSDSSDYAANIEIAAVLDTYDAAAEPAETPEEVETPDQKTIAEVADFLEVAAADCFKSLLFMADGEPVLVVVRGDHEANEIKVKHHLGAEEVVLASEKETLKVLGTEPGFIGPVNTPAEVNVLLDPAVKVVSSGVCGANKSGMHLKNVHAGRDLSHGEYADVRNIQEGDPSPDGTGTICFKEGIEVGHVFKLGTKYSEALKAEYLDDHGRARPVVMGSYGIGVSRALAAVIEEHHDDSGIIWPLEAAPYDVHVIAINAKQEEQLALAESIYDSLRQSGMEVLLDDRTERAGVKFKDADLIGIPVRIQTGKRAAENIVEVKCRLDGEVEEVHTDDLPEVITRMQKKYMQQ